MKKITFDRKKLNSYKDFYIDIYHKFNGKEIHDFDYSGEMLGCNADTLYEFLQYFSDENIHFVFVNFDLDEIKLQKKL